MKKISNWIIVILASFVVFASPLEAQMGMMDQGLYEVEMSENEEHGESVETVLLAILSAQNVSTIQDLDCEQVSESDWERLGDAVMELQHPGEAHEIMDKMMGGEGSESLRQMHIRMGQGYLGCGEGFGPGMMGGTMMGNWQANNRNLKGGNLGMMGFGSMMGYGEYGVFNGILGAVTWLAAMGFLITGAYFFIKKAQK